MSQQLNAKPAEQEELIRPLMKRFVDALFEIHRLNILPAQYRQRVENIRVALARGRHVEAIEEDGWSAELVSSDKSVVACLDAFINYWAGYTHLIYARWVSEKKFTKRQWIRLIHPIELLEHVAKVGMLGLAVVRDKKTGLFTITIKRG